MWVQELRKGITQAKKLRALYEQKNQRFIHDVLGISPDYAFLAAVASQNWIGHAEAQDDEVPIIKGIHMPELGHTGHRKWHDGDVIRIDKQHQD